MQKIKCPDKNIGNPHQVQKRIVLHFSRIPGDNKNSKGHHNGKQLHQGVKQHITLLFTEIEYQN